jgi:hypothetical protein
LSIIRWPERLGGHAQPAPTLLNGGFADSSFVLTIIKAVPRAMVDKIGLDWPDRFTLSCSDLPWPKIVGTIWPNAGLYLMMS